MTEHANIKEAIADPRGQSMLNHLLAFLIASLASIVMLAGYHIWIAGPVAGVAVVDIAGIVKTRESEFTALLARPNVSDADRREAYLLVSRIGPEIEQAVDGLQKECNCTILVKSAVIAGVAQDLTPRLRTMLGMAHDKN